MNKHLKHRLQNAAGWYGVLAILGAYMLLSFTVIAADSVLYQLLNLTGSLGILAVAIAKHDTQPAVLNLIWAAVALVAVLRIIIS